MKVENKKDNLPVKKKREQKKLWWCCKKYAILNKPIIDIEKG